MYGQRSVVFSLKPFLDLKQESCEEDFDQYMAFIDPRGKRYVIDYRDKSEVTRHALDWSDIYAKVNFNSSVVAHIRSKEREKIIPIGPNFGINQWGSFLIYITFLKNLCKLRGLSDWPVTSRQFLAGYNWTRRRRNIDEYQKQESDSSYIFHVSRLYREQTHGEETNLARAEFIRACRQRSDVLVEGGLVGSTDGLANYGDVSLNDGFPTAVYLEKTARSAIVFNTPSAWGCHGWKLGEYMALGKAIISVPFVNDFPPGIEHEKNIYIVNSLGEIPAAVAFLLENQGYRRRLEACARKYYEEHLEPRVQMERIMGLGVQS